MKAYQSYNNKLLLELLCESDEGAFTELYDRLWQKLFAIAYNRLKEVEAAEDIVHDVFASLWANRERIQIDSLENYLATATKYLSLTSIRKRERERHYHNTAIPPQVADVSVENSLFYRNILELLRVEVEKLPEKCRLIFKYRRNDEMPVSQIAKKLSISPKTVENQLNKAQKQLKLAAKPLLNFFLLLVSASGI